MTDRRHLLRALGPGFLFAAVSVGVSHLVQCTRAGAASGLSLGALVAIALVLKYPLFEFGQRYACATGTSLLEGYRRLGKWSLGLYVGLTVSTMFTVVAAVAAVTSGMAIQLTGIQLSTSLWSLLLLTACLLLAILGRYRLLDALIKGIMAILTLSTLAATLAVLPRLTERPLFAPLDFTDAAAVAFAVSLVGWMPTGLDVSVWQSLWFLARKEQTGYKPTLRETLFDFRVGYMGTSILALLFMVLGTAVLFDRDVEIETGAGAFAGQIIRLYTESLGDWSRPLIALAAFTTLFSTLLTVVDGFPRVLRQLILRFRSPEIPEPDDGDGGEDRRSRPCETTPLTLVLMLVVVGGGMLLLHYSPQNLTSLIDLATVLSFITAPLLGLLTYRAMTAPWVPEEARPGIWLRTLAITGIVFLTAFLAFYLVSGFFFPDETS